MPVLENVLVGAERPRVDQGGTGGDRIGLALAALVLSAASAAAGRGATSLFDSCQMPPIARA
jgi:hypothetical protein